MSYPFELNGPRNGVLEAPRRWSSRFGFAMTCVLLSLFAGGFAHGAGVLDYQLKAGYLYNFGKFVDWPTPPLASDSPFIIGVLSDESVYSAMAQTLHERKIAEHPVKFVLLRSEAEAVGCRIVFIPHTSAVTPAEFRKQFPDTAVLLVGEKEGFAAAGGEIGFVPRGDNLRYQVNLSAAQKVGLKLSSHLANLAEIVRTAAP